MVNETASATVIRLSPPANISGPGASRETGKLPEAGGQVLPVEGNKQPRSAQVTTVDIREAISEINEFVRNVQRDLSFNIDEVSGQTIIKVIDRESGDLIRQIPAEEVLAMASHIREVSEIAMDAIEAPLGLLFSDSS